uniref:CASPASE_P20 domain-containing protein n=1 Tax=Macrostomum lignano TaxID=282301 RepID=A0A1I8GYK3_9PLAT
MTSNLKMDYRSLEQQYESKLGSCLPDSVNNSEVQQLIVVVIAGNAFMKDVLDFMTMDAINSLTSPFLCIIREGKLGGDFLRDIFKFIREPKSNLDEVDALPAASEQTAQDKPTDWMRENASIIYPNRRNPKKPRALVIINYDRGDSLYSALQVDRSRVMRMLKNLGYIVTDVQTRSNDALKRRIELFSEDTEHGDSCILVVLSQTQQQLSSSTVMNLYKSLAIGEKLEAKPRLFILHEWDVTTLQTDSVTDGFSSNTYEIIEDAVDGLQAYFRKHDSTIKVHPHSGMVFGRSVSSDVTRAEGSAFIQTLCETFRQYGHTEDVASMITIINEHKRLDESVPKWFIQTGKLFYIMGTDGIQDRTGFAMILTEGQFDGARNYQMFLEYAAFKVLFDYTDGNSSSIKTAIRLPKETEGNVVLYLIVRTHRNDNVLQEIVDELSKQQSSQKCSSSILLIFCEVSESEENFANTQMPEELPEKFSLVRVCRNRCGVIEFLDSLLESPRKNISLNGSLVKKELSTRFGSQYDCQRMADTLLRLGYSVSIRSNLTKVEIESELDMFCSDARHGSSVVVAFMSHGCLGEVVGFDGESAKESKILKRISKGKRTSGKQQLVIFENCRDPGRLPKSELSFFPGMIVAHSTSPDESSYRMTDRGSRFIQCLCTVLDLFADKCDIASMVPIVNYVVQNATFIWASASCPGGLCRQARNFGFESMSLLKAVVNRAIKPIQLGTKQRMTAGFR